MCDYELTMKETEVSTGLEVYFFCIEYKLCTALLQHHYPIMREELSMGKKKPHTGNRRE